jgi:putative transposase
MIAIVIAFLQIIVRLLADLVGLIALSVKPRRSIEAENLFLRRELALFKERGIRPRRVDAATGCRSRSCRGCLIGAMRWS